MIGLFDSGIGGLYILRGIAKKLPQFSYVYLGDSARAPYGARSSEEVYMFTKQGVEFLFAHGATMVVLACNTASSEALRKIQHDYREDTSRKVLGVLIPFAEAAAARTLNKRVGVIATEATVRSGAFIREIQKVDPEIQVFQHACPLLVPLVEAGEWNTPKADTLVNECARPLLAEDIDTLVLGCTHYGLLETKIGKAAGLHVDMVSESDVMPQSLAAYLDKHPEVERRIEKKGATRFYSTGPKGPFEKLGSDFFGAPIHAESATLI